jgi:Putative antitoxin
MSKTITIDDDAYKLLVSLKQGAGDSFTKVIRRHVHKPLENAGELLDAWDELPPAEGELECPGSHRQRTGAAFRWTQMIADTTFLALHRR